MIYRIDSDDRLVYADGAFHRFAAAAGIPDLAHEWYGRSLWQSIGDDELRAVFVALVGRARASCFGAARGAIAPTAAAGATSRR